MSEIDARIRIELNVFHCTTGDMTEIHFYQEEEPDKNQLEHRLAQHIVDHYDVQVLGGTFNAIPMDNGYSLDNKRWTFKYLIFIGELVD